MNPTTPSRLLAAAGVLGLLAGCRSASPVGGRPAAAPELTTVSLVPERAADADEAVLRALELLPTASHGLKADSIGVVVCDPSPGVPAALQDFGRGCSRWLHLEVAGHPQAGQSPHLHSVSRARRELGKTDLGLKPEEVEEAGPPLGVNRVVTCALSGTPESLTLAYQVHALPGGKPVGDPVTLRGTREEVTAGLPDAGKALCKTLQLTPDPIRSRVELKPEELAAAGSAWWSGKKTGLGAQAAASSPLVALVDFPHLSGSELKKMVAGLVRSAPENPLAYAAIGYVQASELLPHKDRLLPLRARYPKSYLLSHSEVWLRRVQNDETAEQAAALAKVRNAPRNPDAWLSFAYTQSEAGDSIRKGRFAGQIAPGEWRKLDQSYGLWLRSAAEAVRLDPQYARAWTKVASSATFAGESELAEAALWSALKLDPDTMEAYTWGLQMYQPKWLDKPDQLRKVAELAAGRKWPLEFDLPGLAAQIDSAGLSDIAGSLRSSSLDRYRKAAAADPNDYWAHFTVARLLDRDGTRAEARHEYQEAIRLRPDEPEPHFRLADSHYRDHRPGFAVKEYRIALRLDPSRATGHYDLGWALKDLHQFEEAEKEFRAAIRLDPHLATAHYGLGHIHAMNGRTDEAIASYRAAAKNGRQFWEAYRDLGQELAKKGRHAEAIAAAEAAVQMRPQEVSALVALSFVYGTANKPKESAEVCRAVLERSPGQPIAHVNLGEALIKLGKKAEAREHLEQAARSGDERVVEEARRLLGTIK